jgi:hypothetical protein
MRPKLDKRFEKNKQSKLLLSAAPLVWLSATSKNFDVNHGELQSVVSSPSTILLSGFHITSFRPFVMLW